MMLQVRTALAVVMMMVCLNLTGCGSADPKVVAEELTVEMIAVFNDMGDLFSTVTDEASANAAAARIKDEIVPRMEKLSIRFNDLKSSMSEEEFKNFDKEMDAELKTGYEQQMQEAMGKFMQRMMILGMSPKLMTPQLQEAMEAFDKAGNALDTSPATAP